MIKKLIDIAAGRSPATETRWEDVFPNAPSNPEDIVAMTIWGECRSETEEGKHAVASVIFNRAKKESPKYFMKGFKYWETRTQAERVLAVCLSPRQFCCWDKKVFTQEKPYKCPSWDLCGFIAKAVVFGDFLPTLPALHYHTTDVHPYWANKLEQIAVIHKHIFYK